MEKSLLTIVYASSACVRTKRGWMRQNAAQYAIIAHKKGTYQSFIRGDDENVDELCDPLDTTVIEELSQDRMAQQIKTNKNLLLPNTHPRYTNIISQYRPPHYLKSLRGSTGIKLRKEEKHPPLYGTIYQDYVKPADIVWDPYAGTFARYKYM